MLNQARIALLAAILLVLGMALLQKTGEYLVLDQPAHADAIVVLAGDKNDRRFSRGLELVHQGFAPRMLLDANSDLIVFGRTPAVLEDQLIRSLNLNPDQVQVCPIQGDSTDEETRYVAQCLHPAQISTVLLVTSDFHTRRALSIFQHRLPNYRWSIAASRDESVFQQNWWQRREWAKTAFMEWTKLIWWEAVDRWRH
jgi:uncharacterized SAM-binding protein YcdF (DUF218 family)